MATLVLLATVGSVLPALAAPGSLLLKAAVVESLVDDGTVRFWVGVTNSGETVEGLEMSITIPGTLTLVGVGTGDSGWVCDSEAGPLDCSLEELSGNETGDATVDLFVMVKRGDSEAPIMKKQALSFKKRHFMPYEKLPECGHPLKRTENM